MGKKDPKGNLKRKRKGIEGKGKAYGSSENKQIKTNKQTKNKQKTNKQKNQANSVSSLELVRGRQVSGCNSWLEFPVLHSLKGRGQRTESRPSHGKPMWKFSIFMSPKQGNPPITTYDTTSVEKG